MAEQSRNDQIKEWEVMGNIPARFEGVAGSYPSLEAIRSSESVLTYQDLEKSSRCLAAVLGSKLGAQPRPVALLIQDGAQMISSLLGVIRAGHFYCALSHKDPPARLAKILLDLDTKLLITDSQSLPQAQQVTPPGCEILLLSDIPDAVDTHLPPEITPEAPLGIFYTSGSTGEPKGVLRTHSYILHRVWIDVHDFEIGAGDRLLYMRQFNVSSSLSNIFDALLTGATLVLYDANSLGTSRLADTLNTQKITIFIPPIEFLRNFLDSLNENSRFNFIRMVILGGDVLFRRDVERLRTHLSEQAVVAHHLSSSESGLLARTILNFNSPIPTDIVPLGFPVPGKEVLILDQDGNQVLGETPGEIAVRTEIVFQGYWRQPDLSINKFCPDPADPSRKVFCTGDLGYYRPDGQLVFLGRKDFRVKIRGYSIDCASVESELMAEPQVKRAVVVPQLDPAGHKRLVAYVVLVSHSTYTTADLRTFLLKRIPVYTVPTVFIFLPDLPLTSSLKVDRKALLPPDWSQIQTTGPFVAPRDEVERKLVSIWQDVLGLERVSIDDAFFDIGGDSLLSLTLFLEIEKGFGVHLPLRTLIDHETIRKIGLLLQDPQAVNLNMVVPFSTGGDGLPVFLIPTLPGDVMGLNTLACLLDGTQPVYGLQAAGVGGENIYKLPVEQIAEKFVKAVQQVQPHGPYCLIGGSFGGLVAYQMAIILSGKGETVSRLGLIDTTPPGPRRLVRPSIPVRLRVQWQNIRSLPVNKIPNYFLERLKGHLFELARRKPIRKPFSVKILEAINEVPDVQHPGRAAHLMYTPRSYFGDVVIFRAKVRSSGQNWDPIPGWRKFILGRINVVEVDGDHRQVYKEPYVAGLARAINAFLE
jgi:amino acid adenylation domain-containing protein